METYQTTVDGEQVSVTLHSLAEYEANGGEYDDTGNAGERFEEDERDQFIAAMTIEAEDAAIGPQDVGVTQDAWWLDSVAGYYLLREWPSTAPLAARCGVS